MKQKLYSEFVETVTRLCAGDSCSTETWSHELLKGKLPSGPSSLWPLPSNDDVDLTVNAWDLKRIYRNNTKLSSWINKRIWCLLICSFAYPLSHLASVTGRLCSQSESLLHPNRTNSECCCQILLFLCGSVCFWLMHFEISSVYRWINFLFLQPVKIWSVTEAPPCRAPFLLKDQKSSPPAHLQYKSSDDLCLWLHAAVRRVDRWSIYESNFPFSRCWRLLLLHSLMEMKLRLNYQLLENTCCFNRKSKIQDCGHNTDWTTAPRLQSRNMHPITDL